MNFFSSINAKLLWSHIGAIFLANLILVAASYHILAKNLLAIEQNSLRSISLHSANMIDDQVNEISENLKLVADGREVKSYLQNFRDDALAEHFAIFQQKFHSLAFINKDGTEELRVVSGIGVDPPDKRHSSVSIKNLLGRPNETQFFTGQNWKNELAPVLRAGLATFSYFGNSFTGILLADIPYSHLLSHFSQLAVGQSGYLALLDTSGNMVLYSPNNPEDNKISTFAKPEKDMLMDPDLFPFHGHGFIRSPFLGEDSLLSYSHVKNLDLNIVAVLPYQEISDKLNDLLHRSLYILLMVTLLGGLLSYYLSRTISKPIIHLTRIIRSIIAGKDETAQLSNIHSKDEVGHLVDSFQEMLENLQSTTVSRDFMDSILTTAAESIIVLTASGEIQLANKASCEILGYELSELIGRSMSDILPADVPLSELLSELSQGMERREMTYRNKKGYDTPVLFSATLLPDPDNQGGIVCVASDISQLITTREALDDNQQYLQSLMNALPTGLMVIDADNHIIIDINPAGCAMFGAHREEIVGQICHKFICPAELGKCPVTDLKDFTDNSERKILTASGQEISILKSVKKIKLSGSTLLIEAVRDITDRKQAENTLKQSEEKLREISITDEQTRLLNRRGFMTLARKQLQIINRTGERAFLIYADVDNLKWINDTLGHGEGDKIILDTAEVLAEVCRKSDIIGRLGGDEFAILLTSSDDETAIVSRLNTEIAAMNKRPDCNYHLSISIGIVFCDTAEEPFSIEKFMSMADTKMYAMKKRRKENSTVYRH